MLPEKKLKSLYKQSLEDPVGYWSKMAEEIHWYEKWKSVCDLKDVRNPKWFSGAKLNVCYNCVDKHVLDGKANKVAIYYRNIITNEEDRIITYGKLLEQVSKLAAVMSNFGVKKGDTVLIHMSNMPEAVFAVLASCRLGAVHAVIPMGVTTSALTGYIEQLKPKMIISAMTGMYKNEIRNIKTSIDTAVSFSKIKPLKCLFYQGNSETLQLSKDQDIIWEEVIDKYGTCECVPVESNHPLFYAYTSGSTGEPKIVVYESGPSLVRYVSENLVTGTKNRVIYFGIKFGWILGHICYMPFITASAVVICEGTSFFKTDLIYTLIQDFKINIYKCITSSLRLLMTKDPKGLIAEKYDFNSLQGIMVGGEKPDMEAMEFGAKIFGAPIQNSWGQTEANGSLGSLYSKEQCEAEKILLFPRTSPGIKLVVLDENGHEVKRGKIGYMAIELPVPPGFVVTLLNNHEKYLKTYFNKFPGFYDTKDKGSLREDGSISLAGRCDDVIIVGGTNVSGTAIEQVILQHHAVSECLVVGVRSALKGEVPIALLIIKDCEISFNVIKEVNDLVYKTFGEAISFSGSVCVKNFPRTITGKTFKKDISDVLNNKLKPESSSSPSLLKEIQLAFLSTIQNLL